MSLPILIALGVLGVIYLNVAITVGLHIHRKPGLDFDNSPAPLLGLVWPVFLGVMIVPNYLKARREKKQAKALEAKAAVKALPPAKNDPINEARELTSLQEKVERMKRELEVLGEEIHSRQADPQVAKALALNKRL